MHFYKDQFFHIYNRGNNSQRIFFCRNNYLYFLGKVRENWLIHCDIISYCLMPNHFHFLVRIKNNYDNNSFLLNEAIAITLRSYTRGINIQENRTGSLFQQKTKAKELIEGENVEICYHYIHQNPLKADLVQKVEDWEFSSFRDYIGLRKGTLPNKAMAIELLKINMETIYEDSYKTIQFIDFSHLFEK